MPKNFLSFHTIFIVNENIIWLEEFIKYYLHIGFDHFYLYDNEDTSGGDGSKTHNKYGFEISENNNQHLLDTILQKYNNKITYIKWQPRNDKNEIIYGQSEGIRHFIDNYGNETEWVAFLDLDEFIFSPTNINIPEYFANLPQNCSCVKIVQKKFEDRNLSKSSFITQTYKCIDKEIGFEWAPKNIVKCSEFIDIDNIHSIQTKGETIHENSDIIRFNHYNVNEKLLIWMKEFYKSPVDFTLNGVDTGMERYKHIFTFSWFNWIFIMCIIITLFIGLIVLYKGSKIKVKGFM